MRIQIIVATREATRLASAPVPASSPDQISRLTKGLSVIGRIQSDLADRTRLGTVVGGPY